MDRVNWYFRQKVTNPEMKQFTDFIEEADWKNTSELLGNGILTGGEVVENSPTDNEFVQVKNTIARDSLGRRVNVIDIFGDNCSSIVLGLTLQLDGIAVPNTNGTYILFTSKPSNSPFSLVGQNIELSRSEFPGNEGLFEIKQVVNTDWGGLIPDQIMVRIDEELDEDGYTAGLSPRGTTTIGEIVSAENSIANASYDEAEVDIRPVNPGKEKWVSLYARFDRDEFDTRLDGNAALVEYISLENFKYIVVAGTEEDVGTNNRPAITSNGDLFLADIQHIVGSDILDAQIDTSRQKSMASLPVIAQKLFEYTNLNVFGGKIEWTGSNLKTTTDTQITLPNVSAFHKVAAFDVAIANGEVAYLTIDRTVTTQQTLALTVVARGSVPMGESNQLVLVFAERMGTKIQGLYGGELEPGEIRDIGDSIGDAYQELLAMNSEVDTSMKQVHPLIVGLGNFALVDDKLASEIEAVDTKITTETERIELKVDQDRNIQLIGSGAVGPSVLGVTVDEQQRIDYSTLPDGGDFILSHDGNSTAVLPFNESNANIQAALNGLASLSGVVVSGNFTSGHVIDFLVGDSAKNQPLLVVSSNNLVAGVIPVEATPSTVTDGSTGLLNFPMTSSLFLQMSGLQDARNEILSAIIALTHDGSVAYIIPNRDVGVDATVALQYSDITELPSEGVVIARRLNGNKIIFDDRVVVLGESHTIGDIGSGGGSNSPNIRSLTFGENIGGQIPVELFHDGGITKVKKMEGVEGPGVQIPRSIFTSSSVTNISTVWDSINERIVHFYQNSTLSNHLYAVVGEVDADGAIAYGAEIPIHAVASISTIESVFEPNSGKIIAIYKISTGSVVNAVVCEVGVGSTITAGTPVPITGGDMQPLSIALDSDTNQVGIFYQDSLNSDFGTGILGAVSGTSMTFGSPNVFESSNMFSTASAYDTGNSKFGIHYGIVGSLGFGIAATVSGTDLAFSSKTPTFNLNNDNMNATFDSFNGNIISTYIAGTAQKVIALNLDAVAPVFSLVQEEIVASGSGYPRVTADNLGNVLHTRHAGGGVSGETKVITSVGTVLTLSTGFTLPDPAYQPEPAYIPSLDKFLIGYIDGDTVECFGQVGRIVATDFVIPDINTVRVITSTTTNMSYRTVVWNDAQDKFIQFYQIGGLNQRQIDAVVGEVSAAGVVTFGAAVTVVPEPADDEQRFLDAKFDSNSGNVILSFARENGGNDFGYLTMITISGLTPAGGNPLVPWSASKGRFYCLNTIGNTGKFFLAHRNGANQSVGRIGTITGVNIALGAEQIFAATELGECTSVWDSANNKIGLVYTDQASPDGIALSATYVGTVLTFETPDTIGNILWSTPLDSVFDSASGKMAVIYRETNGGNGEGHLRVIDFSAATPTFSAATFLSNFIGTKSISVNPSGEIVIMANVSDGASIERIFVFTASGLVITPTGTTDLRSSFSLQDAGLAYIASLDMFLLSSGLEGSVSTDAVVGTIFNGAFFQGIKGGPATSHEFEDTRASFSYTTANYHGITQESGNIGTDHNVAIFAGISTGHSAFGGVGGDNVYIDTATGLLTLVDTGELAGLFLNNDEIVVK